VLMAAAPALASPPPPGRLDPAERARLRQELRQQGQVPWSGAVPTPGGASAAPQGGPGGPPGWAGAGSPPPGGPAGPASGGAGPGGAGSVPPAWSGTQGAPRSPSGGPGRMMGPGAPEGTGARGPMSVPGIGQEGGAGGMQRLSPEERAQLRRMLRERRAAMGYEGPPGRAEGPPGRVGGYPGTP